MFLKSIKFQNSEFVFSKDISIIRMPNENDRQDMIKAIVSKSVGMSFEDQGEDVDSIKDSQIAVIDKEIMSRMRYSKKDINGAILNLVGNTDAILKNIKIKMSESVNRISFFVLAFVLTISGVLGSPFNPFFIFSPILALVLLILGMMFPVLLTKKVLQKDKIKIYNLFKQIFLEAKNNILETARPVLKQELKPFFNESNADFFYLIAYFLFLKFLNNNKRSLLLIDSPNDDLRLRHILEDFTEHFQIIIFKPVDK